MTGRRRKSSVIMPDSTTCDCGKRGYWEKKVAKTIVTAMRREGATRDPQDLNAYRCPDGTGLWHVGHKTKLFLGPNLNDPRLRFI